ncbi:MAG: tetratricopeptide repeat protein [Deltaproteobacteria bacterium]|nr:tetratricopeptide repeat protein [Deltaproteobacteria bacterium]
MIPGKVKCAILIVLIAFSAGCAEPARRLYDAAGANASLGEWDSAKTLYSDLLETYPQSRFAPGAAVKLADIFAFVEKDFRAAMEMYDLLQLHYPQSSLVPVAMVKKAEILKERRQDPTGSLELLERIYQQHPDFQQRDYVLILMARCLESAENYAMQRAYLRELILSFPASPHSAEAHYLYGMSCLAHDLIDEALLAFKNFLCNYPDSRFAARAEIGYAEALREKRGKNEAANYLTAILTRYPSSDQSILSEQIKILQNEVSLSVIKIPGKRLGGRR